MKIVRSYVPIALLALTGACGPRIRPLERVMENGEVLRPRSEEVVERARVEGEAQREQLAEQRGEAAASALASCSGAVCEAITRGEVALGMSEAQVLAATRTTAQAWDVRGDGRAGLMTPRSDLHMPEDALGAIAFVNFQNGRVASYTYRESQGFRTVASPADASFAGRSAAQADALLRQGDEFTAAGRLDLGLEKYDQADILRPGHPETTLRIARTLDKQLRPIEAIMRYQMFIHQMELERIRAEGDVAAKIAEAIARAHERIVVLERR